MKRPSLPGAPFTPLAVREPYSGAWQSVEGWYFWEALNALRLNELSEAQLEVLAVMRLTPETGAEIAARCGRSRQATNKLLLSMQDHPAVKRLTDGRWHLTLPILQAQVYCRPAGGLAACECAMCYWLEGKPWAAGERRAIFRTLLAAVREASPDLVIDERAR